MVEIEALTGCNLLITGATGLVGSALVDLLLGSDVGLQVYAAGRNELRANRLFAKYASDSRFHFIQYDVLDSLDSDIDFHYIIHAASGASPNAFVTDPVGVMRANIEGVTHLMEYGINHQLKRFLLVSSGEVYGNGTQQSWSETESGYVDSMTLRACYPSAKRAAETLCVAYAHQYGIEVVVARLCHVYGSHFTENDNRVYAQFIRNVLHGEDIVLKSTGETYRSWLYVVDAASALLTVLLKGTNCEAYNVADESGNVTIKELAEKIAYFANREVKYDLPTQQERKGFSQMTRNIYNTTRLRSLGWNPSFSLEEGLRETIKNANF